MLLDKRGWLADLPQDARYGVRSLRRTPVFTTVALVTLALGIGANTAIFSLLNLLVLRDLPVRDPAQLVQFTWQYPGDPPMNMFGRPDYERFRDGSSVFSDLFGTAPFYLFRSAPFRFETRNAAIRMDTLNGEYVTGNFFPALGVRPAIGRLLGPNDDAPGAPAVAVVSWRFWKTRFNLDPAVLETQVVVNGVNAAVVGVTGQAFSGLVTGYTPDVWITGPAFPGTDRMAFMLMARLKDGASIEQARAEMRVLDRPRIEGFAVKDPQWRKVLLDVSSARAGFSTPLHVQFGTLLWVLMAIAGSLLLLACANIGSLLLARGAIRQREMAVRVSLGAGRFRIVRQMLTESLLLATAGGLLGVLGAYVGADLLVRMMISGTWMMGPPPRLDVTIDAPVLIFTTGVTVLAALLFGLAPAWSAFASAPASALRETGAAGQTRSRRLFGNGLVVAQVAMSLVLLTMSLYIGHLASLRGRSLGFDRTSVLLVNLEKAPVDDQPESRTHLYKELLARFEAIPGVRSAAISALTPISGAAGSEFVQVEGFDEPPQARRRLLYNAVAPGYFQTFGTPLVAGRDFQPADEGRPRVAIVNQAMARYYFADRNPLGRRVLFEGDAEPYEIIGVVADAKYADVRSPAPPAIYLHYFQQTGMAPHFAIRTHVPPTAIAGDVRRLVTDVLRTTPISNITTLAEQVDASIGPERLVAMLSGYFGALGTLLAAIGLYGLLAYSVARRTSEIGIRMALGATRADVTRMVMRNAAWLVCAGLVIGAPLAFWSKRAAASMLENLPADSLSPVLVAIAATLVVASAAAYVPTRIDPLSALRSE